LEAYTVRPLNRSPSDTGPVPPVEGGKMEKSKTRKTKGQRSRKEEYTTPA